MCSFEVTRGLVFTKKLEKPAPTFQGTVTTRRKIDLRLLRNEITSVRGTKRESLTALNFGTDKLLEKKSFHEKM